MMPQDASPFPFSSSVLPNLLSQAKVLVGLFDEHDRLVWANTAFCEALAVAPGSHPTWVEIMRHCHATQLGTVINTNDIEAWLASAASRRGKLPYRQFETDLHDGRWILMTETVDERGWMLCLGSDVSDLARDHRELRVARDQAQRASLVDALTGMGNRSFVMTQLNQRLAARQDTPLCVVMTDVDHFKQINDSVGHSGGDAVLCDFARLLQQGIRRMDVCGRMGGEEFMAVLEGLSLKEAEQVMQRVLASVRASRPLAQHPDLSYRVSMGLAQAVPGEAAASLISRADAALYQAKGQGRDQCMLA